MRTGLGALGALAVIGMLGGCAAGGGGGGEDDESLEVMGFSLTDEIAETRIGVAETALDVHAELAEGEFDQQAFLSAVASGDVPDLVYLPRAQLGGYAARGAVMPLDECLADAGADPGEWIESARDGVTLDDTVFGIPEFDQVGVSMINARVLDEAGVAVEDVDGSDWDALADAAASMAVVEGGDVEVIGYDPKLPEFLPLWAHANGADLLSDDGRTAQLDDPRVVEALEYTAGLIEAQGGWAAVKAAKDASDFFGEGNQFASDTLGAMPMENWYLNVLADVSPAVELTVIPFLDRTGEPIAYATGNVWAVPTGSAQADRACAFAAAMTEPDAWLEAAQNRADARASDDKVFTGLLTGNAVADEAIMSEVYEPSGNAMWDDAVAAVVAADAASFSMPVSAAPQEFEDAWRAAVDRVLTGQQTAEQALGQAQQEAQAALDAARG